MAAPTGIAFRDADALLHIFASTPMLLLPAGYSCRLLLQGSALCRRQLVHYGCALSRAAVQPSNRVVATGVNHDLGVSSGGVSQAARVNPRTRRGSGARAAGSAGSAATLHSNSSAYKPSEQQLLTLDMLIDKDKFEQRLTVLALRVPKQKCAEMMRKFRGSTLDRPKVRCLVQDGEREDTKLLLLDDKLQQLSELSDELQEVIRAESMEHTTHEVVLGYACLSAQQVLRRLLPKGVEVPTSFECVGHIAHLNLREDQLPYKAVIGQVILDKNPILKTVVNKVDSIQNEFRVFPMEVIAGQASLETEVVQHGSRFRLDFSRVYWNSRLEAEHSRLVRQFSDTDVIVDIMAGIGPFAVPAAQKGCTVYANDLNPDSAHYMAANVKLNKVTSKVHVFNMDGRRFVRLLLDSPDTLPAQAAGSEAASQALQAGGQDGAGGEQNPGGDGKPVEAPAGEGGEAAGPASRPGLPPAPEGFSAPKGGLIFQHAVMNLPASAIEFLDAFRGAFDPEVWKGRLPKVHVYTFQRGTETREDILAKAEHYLGGKLDKPAAVHMVRDVAPNKYMLCVSFTVPEAVAFSGRVAAATLQPSAEPAGPDEPSEKRQKTA